MEKDTASFAFKIYPFFFFLLSSIVLSGCKSDYLGGFYFLAAFLIKHVPASFAFPFFWNIDNNLHIWKKLSFHWQLTEKHSQFIRLVKVLKKKSSEIFFRVKE